MSDLLLQIPPAQRTDALVEAVERDLRGEHHWDPPGAVIRTLCAELDQSPESYGISYSLQSTHPFTE